jgi:SAM-dependent methyltransferase
MHPRLPGASSPETHQGRAMHATNNARFLIMTDPAVQQFLDILQIIHLQEKPAPFTPGEPRFWTDPHIAQQMLVAHLDPTNDAASRRPETIQKSVDWMVSYLGLKPGDQVLDLGCGPGLYTARLAAYGLEVTGVDFSQNSIDYAIEYAKKHVLRITYRCQNYLELEDKDLYTAALLIYGDYCPLSPVQRQRLLENVRRALKPGGKFVFDVTTPLLRKWAGHKNAWYAAKSGFWKPGPHLVLEQGFAYENDLFLDQYTVIEVDGKISIYRDWFQDFSMESISSELENAGFVIDSLWGSLTGTPCEPSTEWIGVVAYPG